MNKYEKLRYICDDIWYNFNYKIINNFLYIMNPSIDSIYPRVVDEREIIFHTEFMKFFIKYYLPEWYSSGQVKALYINIMLNLENPTDYLHKLIIWKQTQ